MTFSRVPAAIRRSGNVSVRCRGSRVFANIVFCSRPAQFRCWAGTMWSLTLLLLGVSGQPARVSYTRWRDAYSLTAGWTSAAPSAVGCAVSCERRADPECEGFTWAENGTCHMFSNAAVCRGSAPPAGSSPVHYVQVGSPGAPCPPGWEFFRDSCYLLVMEKLVWEEARAACLAIGACSDLTSVNDMTKVAWLLHRESRSGHGEMVGARRLDGHLVNVDGTAPPEEALREYTEDACFALRFSYQHEIRARNCSLAIPAYICESPLLCRSGTPCPDGWPGLDDYCYHYTSTETSWQEADTDCAGLQPGARLAPIVNTASFRVLFESFSPPSAVFVGVSDLETEGEFQSVDGSAWNVTWKDGQPDNSGGTEHCVAMDAGGADDVSCTLSLPYVCRLDRRMC